jgi:hypothetical protein
MPNKYLFFDYLAASSRAGFTIGNGPRDARFFQELNDFEADFACFSTGDADSIMMQKFICLFGNNDNLKSWHFFFKLFARGAGFSTRVDGVSLGAGTRSSFSVTSRFLRNLHGERFVDIKTPSSHYFYKKRRLPRSLRA